jgi:hypothetical protein
VSLYSSVDWGCSCSTLSGFGLLLQVVTLNLCKRTSKMRSWLALRNDLLLRHCLRRCPSALLPEMSTIGTRAEQQRWLSSFSNFARTCAESGRIVNTCLGQQSAGAYWRKLAGGLILGTGVLAVGGLILSGSTDCEVKHDPPYRESLSAQNERVARLKEWLQAHGGDMSSIHVGVSPEVSFHSWNP